MVNILFIRHGSTEGNLRKRYIGRTDEPLCPEGIAQVLQRKEQMPPIDRLFVSPMKRARQTAELLFPGIEYTIVDELRETDFGIFEGKCAAELASDPDYRRWVDSWCQDAIPGGEAVDAFKKRCCAAFCHVMDTVTTEQTIAFVVHGGTIMAIMEAYAQPPRDYYDYQIGNGEQISCFYENGILF